MSRVFVTMAMSLDGFITGPDDNAENPAGSGGMRLMDWLSSGESQESQTSQGSQGEAETDDRDVMLHGADTTQQALKAGVLDAIELQLRPVLLGQGRRLFDHLSADHIELELVRVLEAPGTLHLRYDVVKKDSHGAAATVASERSK